MGVFQNNLMGAAAAAASAGGGDFYDHQIANSFRFDAGYLQRTPSSAGNRQVWTFSCWVKKTQNVYMNILDAGSGGNQDSRIRMYWYDNKLSASSANANFNASTALYRDTSAWQHVVWKLTGGTSYQYVNGTLASSYSVSGDTAMSNTVQHRIGIDNATDTSSKFLGYIAEVVFIDGTALDPTSFASEKNGVWIPDDVSGLTFGSQGYHLDFASASDPGNDVSGNNNDWTNVSLATHDQTSDSPTFNSSSNGGNFCTANAVYRGESTTSGQYGTLSEGNLKHSYSGSSDGAIPCTHKVPASGKWYFEYRIDAGGGTSNYSPAMGIMDPNEFTFTSSTIGQDGLISYDNAQNRIEKNDVIVGTYSGSRGSNGDVMGIAVDMDNGAFYVSKNGTFQTISGGSTGDPTSGASKTGAGATWTPASEYTSGMVPMSQPTGGNVPIITMNFGQEGTFGGTETAGGNSDTNGYGNFFSAVPSGYSAICSGALTVPDAVDPAQTDDDYPQKLFSPLIWTGDGTTSRAITGLGFQPDFLWFKSRSSAFSNRLYNTSRGIASNGGKRLFSNTSGAETDQTSGQDISAVGTDGFTMGASSNLYNNDTNSGGLNVGWFWRANGSTTAANSVGGTSSVTQVDPSGGFSIVTYTGISGSSGSSTVGHGMSVAPQLIFHKALTASGGWWSQFASGTNANYFLELNDTRAQTELAAGTYGAMSRPTTSVFSINGVDGVGGESRNYIAFCFGNIEGYSKVGSFVGNGNTNGPFVYTGFRPSLVMRKRFDGSGSWIVKDDARNPTNDGSIEVLTWNDSQAENPQTETSDGVDFLSNGFKLKATNNGSNGNGLDYTYLALSFNPFKYSTAF